MRDLILVWWVFVACLGAETGRSASRREEYFCLALFIAGFLITFFETILYASIEGFPTILTYGIEFRDKQWQSVRNPIGPLPIIFNTISI